VPGAFKAWDDYFIPGTEVLRNRPGFSDAAMLARFEHDVTRLRIFELSAKPIPGDFDYAHMKAIHRHIFQDVYDWAGQERVGPGRMTKSGVNVVTGSGEAAYAYFPAEYIAENAEDRYALLAEEHLLVGLPQAEFVDRLADHWGEINVIHSFREGNTRAQFVFFKQLSENAGYLLDAAQFRIGSPLRDEFVAARFENQASGSHRRLAAVLARAVRPREPKRNTSVGASTERQPRRGTLGLPGNAGEFAPKQHSDPEVSLG